MLDIFMDYAHSEAYPITCVLLFFVAWMFWKKGGITKPKKENIWKWVQTILDYLNDRKKS